MTRRKVDRAVAAIAARERELLQDRREDDEILLAHLAGLAEARAIVERIAAR